MNKFLLKDKTIRCYKSDSSLFKYDFTKIPYLSTYDFEEKVDINNDVIIPLYISDYYQKEFLYDEHSEYFSLTYSIEDRTITIDNIPAGDYTLNLGKCTSIGEKEIWIQITDCRGTKSIKLYKYVLIIDDSYEITEAQTYTITQEDLDKYGIKNTNSTDETDLTNTREGLTSLFQEIKNNGYRKAVLLNGTYRINYTENRVAPILIPTEFTVDLNGSTIKLNENNLSANLIIKMKDCFDSHLINGTIEGDYAERKASNTIANGAGEGVFAVDITGDSRYSSIEDLKIMQNTGHTILVTGNEFWSRIPLNPESVIFKNNTKINFETGKEETFKGVMTCNAIDISNMLSHGMIMVGVLLASGGVLGSDYTCFMSFYKEDNTFIETITTQEYRHIRIPNDSKYLRITLIGSDFVPAITYHQLQDFKKPINCTIKNIDFEDTRTCALAPCQLNDFRFKDIRFTRCGYGITPVPIDFEDGWQNTIDAYLNNCNIIEKAVSQTAGMIVCAGFNYVIENCTNLGRTVFRGGVNGGVFRNNTGSTQFEYENRNKAINGCCRVYNNNFGTGGSCIFKSTDDNYRVVKNCTFFDSSVAYSNLLNCTLDFTVPKPSDLDLTILFNNVNFYNCKIRNIPSTACRTFNTTFINTEISNSTFDVLENENRFVNSIIDNLTLRFNGEKPVMLNFVECNSIKNLYIMTNIYNYSVKLYKCNITLDRKEMINGDSSNNTVTIEKSNITITPENINVITIPQNKKIKNQLYTFKNSVFNLNGGKILSANFNNTVTPPVIINNLYNEINNGNLVTETALTNPNVRINEK